MTTINEIRNWYADAQAESDLLVRARKMNVVQRNAAQSRSQHAYDLEFKAHSAIEAAYLNYAGDDNDYRSELGRERSESRYAFRRGNTNSRDAIRAE